MEKEDIISSGLLEMYVMGAASPEEAVQVEAWRSQYPEVVAELMSIEKAMESYAVANAVSPRAAVKDELFSSLNLSPTAPNTTQQTAKVVSMGSRFKMVAAAAILLLIGSSIFNFIYYNKYKDADSKNQQQEQQLAQLNQHMSDMDSDMNVVQNVVRNKYSQPVSLNGLPVAPDAAARIFWVKNTNEVWVDPGNLPMAPQGMQYQLWAIVDGKPVDGGMITSKDGKTYKIQQMKSFGKAQAFAITLETAGGHPEPKGKMYVMGTI